MSAYYTNLISNLVYFFNYYFLTVKDFICDINTSFLDVIKTDKLKKSIYKIEAIDTDVLKMTTIFKRPLRDIVFFRNKTYAIEADNLIENFKQDECPNFLLITLWDNSQNLIKFTRHMNLNKDIYNVNNKKYIIVLIQAPIKLDITHFINSNSLFNGKTPIKITNILLLMYFLKYIDNNMLIYLLSHIRSIVISTMDGNINEKIMRYSDDFSLTYL